MTTASRMTAAGQGRGATAAPAVFPYPHRTVEEVDDRLSFVSYWYGDRLVVDTDQARSPLVRSLAA